MDEAFIVVSIVSGLFTLAGISLLNHNWFKKETFKLDIFNQKKEYNLRLKKLERDLGLTKTKTSHPPTETAPAPDTLSSLLSIAKGLNPEQLTSVLEMIKGAAADGDLPEKAEGLMGIIDEHPELVEAFLKGLGKGKDEGGGETTNDPDMI